MNRKALGLVAVITAVAGAILVLENPFLERSISGDGEGRGGRPIGNEVGWQAPGFTLETLDGSPVSLADFRGRVVIVNFWATWCPFCVSEMPAFQMLHEEMGDDVVVIGINRAESVEKQEDFLRNQLDTRITYLLLKDPSDAVAKEYGVLVMPTTFILDGDGVIVKKRLGEMSLREMRLLAEEAIG